METYEYTCTDCGAKCETELHPKGNRREFCLGCAKQRDGEAKKRYEQNQAGKDASRRATARWVASERGAAYMADYAQSAEGRARAAERQRRYRQRPGVAERQRAYSEQYRRTPKGRAVYILNTQRQRFPDLPMGNLARVVLEITHGIATCYTCGAPATEADHVLPVAMAELLGILADVDEYVAAVCSECHRTKSNRDIADLRRMRKAFATA